MIILVFNAEHNPKVYEYSSAKTFHLRFFIHQNDK